MVICFLFKTSKDITRALYCVFTYEGDLNNPLMGGGSGCPPSGNLLKEALLDLISWLLRAMADAWKSEKEEIQRITKLRQETPIFHRMWP